MSELYKPITNFSEYLESGGSDRAKRLTLAEGSTITLYHHVTKYIYQPTEQYSQWVSQITNHRNVVSKIISKDQSIFKAIKKDFGTFMTDALDETSAIAHKYDGLFISPVNVSNVLHEFPIENLLNDNKVKDFLCKYAAKIEVFEKLNMRSPKRILRLEADFIDYAKAIPDSLVDYCRGKTYDQLFKGSR